MEGAWIMNIITEIKPCPFCGSENLSLKEKLDTCLGDLYYVFCYHCEAISGKYGTPAIAKENWNKRTEEIAMSKEEAQDTAKMLRRADYAWKQDKANIRAYREALALIRDKANKGASAVCASIADRALDEL